MDLDTLEIGLSVTDAEVSPEAISKLQNELNQLTINLANFGQQGGAIPGQPLLDALAAKIQEIKAQIEALGRNAANAVVPFQELQKVLQGFQVVPNITQIFPNLAASLDEVTRRLAGFVTDFKAVNTELAQISVPTGILTNNFQAFLNTIREFPTATEKIREFSLAIKQMQAQGVGQEFLPFIGSAAEQTPVYIQNWANAIKQVQEQARATVAPIQDLGTSTIKAGQEFVAAGQQAVYLAETGMNRIALQTGSTIRGFEDMTDAVGKANPSLSSLTGNFSGLDATIDKTNPNLAFLSGNVEEAEKSFTKLAPAIENTGGSVNKTAGWLEVFASRLRVAFDFYVAYQALQLLDEALQGIVSTIAGAFTKLDEFRLEAIRAAVGLQAVTNNFNPEAFRTFLGYAENMITKLQLMGSTSLVTSEEIARGFSEISQRGIFLKSEEEAQKFLNLLNAIALATTGSGQPIKQISQELRAMFQDVDRVSADTMRTFERIDPEFKKLLDSTTSVSERFQIMLNTAERFRGAQEAITDTLKGQTSELQRTFDIIQRLGAVSPYSEIVQDLRTINGLFIQNNQLTQTGKDIIALWQNTLDTVWQVVKSIGTAFQAVWEVLKLIFDTVDMIAVSFSNIVFNTDLSYKHTLTLKGAIEAVLETVRWLAAGLRLSADLIMLSVTSFRELKLLMSEGLTFSQLEAELKKGNELMDDIKKQWAILNGEVKDTGTAIANGPNKEAEKLNQLIADQATKQEQLKQQFLSTIAPGKESEFNAQLREQVELLQKELTIIKSGAPDWQQQIKNLEDAKSTTDMLNKAAEAYAQEQLKTAGNLFSHDELVQNFINKYKGLTDTLIHLKAQVDTAKTSQEQSAQATRQATAALEAFDNTLRRLKDNSVPGLVGEILKLSAAYDEEQQKLEKAHVSTAILNQKMDELRNAVINKAIDLAVGEMDKLNKSIDDNIKKLDAQKAALDADPIGKLPPQLAQVTEAQNALNNLIAEANILQDKANISTGVAKEAFERAAATLLALVDSTRQHIDALSAHAQATAKDQQQTEALRSAYESSAKALADAQAKQEAIREAMRLGLPITNETIDRLTKELELREKLNVILNSNADSVKKELAETALANAQLAESISNSNAKILQNAELTFKTFNKLGTDTARELEQDFSKFFFDAFTGKLNSLTDVFKSFTSTLLKILSDFLAASVIQLSGLGDLITNLFSTLGSKAAIQTSGGSVLGGLFNPGNIISSLSRIPSLFGGAAAGAAVGGAAGAAGLQAFGPSAGFLTDLTGLPGVAPAGLFSSIAPYLPAVGAGAFGLYSLFSGDIGGGIGGILGGGLSAAMAAGLLGTAAGPFAPIAAIALPLIGNLLGSLFKKQPFVEIDVAHLQSTNLQRYATMADFLEALANTSSDLANKLVKVWEEHGGSVGGTQQARDAVLNAINQQLITPVQSIIKTLPDNVGNTILQAFLHTPIEYHGDQLTINQVGDKIAQTYQAFLSGQASAQLAVAMADFWKQALTALGVEADKASALIDEKIAGFWKSKNQAQVGQDLINTLKAYADAFNILNNTASGSIAQTISQVQSLASTIGFTGIPTLQQLKDKLQELFTNAQLDPTTVQNFVNLRTAIINLDQAISKTIGDIAKQIDDLNSKIVSLGGTYLDVSGYTKQAIDNLQSLISSGNLNPDEMQAALQQMTGLVDQYVSEQLAAIKAVNDAQIQALQSQKNAIQSQIDNLNNLKTSIQNTYQTQLDALNTQLDTAKQYDALTKTIRGDIQKLFIGSASPLTPQEQINYLEGQIASSKTQLSKATTDTQKQAIISAIEGYEMSLLDVAGRSFGIGTPQYQAIWTQVGKDLSGLLNITRVQGDTVEALTQKIADLTAQEQATLNSIDARIKALQSQSQAIDTQIAALQAQETQLTGQARAEALAYYEFIRNEQYKLLQQSLNNLQSVQTPAQITAQATQQMSNTLNNILIQSTTQTNLLAKFLATTAPASGGPNPLYNFSLHYAEGGIINEPVYGIGTRSGLGYIIGEAGPERITPLRDSGVGVGKVIINLSHEIHGAVDPGAVSQKIRQDILTDLRQGILGEWIKKITKFQHG